MLVSLWQENIRNIESTCSHEIWVKIKAIVDNLGPAKTIKQCKDKMKNLKDAYERAKESNKKTCVALSFLPYFSQIDEFFGCRDVMNSPQKKLEVQNDKTNASSDWNSDVNKSNILKQVPKKVLAKEDDVKLNLIFQSDKSCP